MAYPFNRIFLLLFIVCILTGCANIVSPTGGRKDTIPPKLVATNPPDSQLHLKPKKIELRFDEYITLNDASSQVQISPLLTINPTVTSVNKKVTIKIPDTLLQDNTTYRISFGTAIKDLHEGNAFKDYTYTFSTGSYFDSLQLSGTVLNAATGLADTGAVQVELYNGSENDSAVVKKKPLYITKAGADGAFSFKGLPSREFRIYAVKDYNNNLIYDGAGEWIGFSDTKVKAGDSTAPPILLRIFSEPVDTSNRKTDSASRKADSVKQATAKTSLGGLAKAKNKTKEGFDYSLDVDTTNVRNRTKDITKPIEISFTKRAATINHDRMSLAYDSSAVLIQVSFSLESDTAKNKVYIKANWQENTVYALKLLKGFAKDTSGADAMPSRYNFRTKRDEDYSKLYIHLVPKYVDSKNILLVKNDRDTVYNHSVVDTLVSLTRLRPADYTILIIVDKNGNGKWDPGKLLEKVQPEMVIPYGSNVTLKPGWENTIDFVPQENTGKSKWGKEPNKKPK